MTVSVPYLMPCPYTAGLPYPNGRNQESVSESINAYESLALYGAVMTQVFEGVSQGAVVLYLNSNEFIP